MSATGWCKPPPGPFPGNGLNAPSFKTWRCAFWALALAAAGSSAHHLARMPRRVVQSGRSGPGIMAEIVGSGPGRRPCLRCQLFGAWTQFHLAWRRNPARRRNHRRPGAASGIGWNTHGCSPLRKLAHKECRSPCEPSRSLNRHPGRARAESLKEQSMAVDRQPLDSIDRRAVQTRVLPTRL